MRHRVTFVCNKCRGSSVLAEGDDMLLVAKQKLRLPKAQRLFEDGVEVPRECRRDCTVYVSCGEEYHGPACRLKAPVSVVGSNIESDAIAQLEKVATLPGVTAVFGMPDLHSGPTGCAVLTAADCVYPHLAGGDIGCGVALFNAGKVKAFSPVAVVKRVRNLAPLDPCHIAGILGVHEISRDDEQLGTIGAGNHFAEFMTVDEVVDGPALRCAGVNSDDLLLCVHSGSRHLGKAIFDTFGSGRLASQNAIQGYMVQHDRAVAWARLNRRTIASRILDLPGAHLEQVLDITHNSIESTGEHHIHRKGAAPADRGIVLVPGSRGTSSFLVQPAAQHTFGSSIAHGSGRQLTRAKAHAKSLKRYGHDLRHLKDGSVHCSSPQLLAEEAPEAYKDINGVIADMSEMVGVVAKLKPLLTIKDFGPGVR